MIPAGLTVALALDTPAATTLIAGQALAELARLTFTNGDAAEVRVTRMVLTRTGISADATLSAVYLYDGVRRLTEMATVSAGRVTFVNAAGIFTIPAGGSRTVSVMSNILVGTVGQTIGVRISAATDVESNATALLGTFPISGNLMSIATAALARVEVGATGIGVATIDPGTINHTVWRSELTVGERAVNLRALQLRQIGSIRAGDLQNFRLFVGGVERAKASLAADNTLTFDLSAAPMALTVGRAAVEVRADIVSGSARTFSFALWRASDLDVRDAEFNVNVLATGPFPVSAPTTGIHTISTGRITVTRAADSPVGMVVAEATDVVLARYTLAAFGESVRVERLRVDGITTVAAVTLRNGRLLARGVQVGSTAGIITGTTAVLRTGTTYELGGALVVVPGSPVTLEVRADIFDSEGTNDIRVGHTLTASLAVGVNNAQALESLTLLPVPAAVVSGNTLTVASGALILARNAAVGDMNVVAGTTNVRIGSFVLQTGAAEAVNISNYEVRIATGVLANLSNLRISESPLVIGSVALVNNFAVTQAMAVNSTRIVDVFVDISPAAAGTIIPSLAVTARGATTGAVLTTPAVPDVIPGQTIRIVVGALTMVRDAGTPVSAIHIGGTTAPVARYRFDATHESFTITEARVAIMRDDAINAVTGIRIGAVTSPLVVAADSALAQTSAPKTVVAHTTVILPTVDIATRFKIGQRVTIASGTGTVTGSPVTRTIIGIAAATLTLNEAYTITTAGTVIVTPLHGTATFTGEILTVPANANAVLTVEAVFNTVAPGAGDTGDAPIFSLTSYTSRSASGVIALPVLYGVSPLIVANADSNLMVLRRTVPTVTLNPAGLSNLLGGIDHEVLRIDIAANPAEDVDIREIRVTPTISDPVTGGAGIAIFQGTIERGRVMNVGETIAVPPANVTCAAPCTIAVAAGALTRYQVGQRVTISAVDVAATHGAITTIISDTSIMVGVALTDTVVGTSNPLTIAPAGYTTGFTYRIPLAGAVVPRGTTSVFTVRADTAGLGVAGRSIQLRILTAAVAGTLENGHLIWREGTVAPDINGFLVRELPITGPALIR
ncbi:MAG: hypothetical protein DDT32_01544 [Syntrophomonadaceae bacterium]|nr:hypothetical protein [Bacillota bacterium]